MSAIKDIPACSQGWVYGALVSTHPKPYNKTKKRLFLTISLTDLISASNLISSSGIFAEE